MSNKPQKSPVFAFAADANFLLPLVVALTSLARNCREPIRAVVFTTDIPSAQRKRTENVFRLKAPLNSTLTWFDLDPTSLRHFPLGFKHLSVLAYARIFMPRIIGRDVEELIYLDCDTVITGNLLAWIKSEPLGNFPIAAVRDFIAPNWNSPAGLPYLVDGLDTAPIRPIFNSGVLRINIPAWIDLHVEEDCIAFIRTHGKKVKGDQDVLNFVFRDRWKPLTPKWNTQAMVGKTEGLESEFLQKIDQVSLRDNAVIHFCMRHKPWNSGLHKSQKITLWLQALRASGWLSPLTYQLWRASRFTKLTWNYFRARFQPARKPNA